MGAFSYNDNSIEGDLYIQRLASYIRRNEDALANGLLCFLKHRAAPAVKPLRLSFTIHHLYCVSERLELLPLGVDVGPLNVKLDNPNHEPTFISFMANNARSSKHFESDARSVSSINSMKSMVSSASVYWRSLALSKDPKTINKDLRYLYSSFTKVPCLILTPKTKVNSISGYEEYPCDTSVPLKMFKNLQVLEMVDYEPNEVFGWNILSEQLRILIVRNAKIADIAEILFGLVIDDESGRSAFSAYRAPKKSDHDAENAAFRYAKREKSHSVGGAGSLLPKDLLSEKLRQEKNYHTLPDNKWTFLKQLTVSETSITSIPAYIFKPLSNLVKLNLSNNLLTELPEGLDQLHNLKYLNVADNFLTSLKNLPHNLKYLSTINFNNNKLESVDGVEHLPSIEKLDFRRNRLNEVRLLRPIVAQFMRNPEKFTSVYLSSNSLPKGYRVDVFNLFNGVKYKNQMKIDDSRPGYFESALLLDADSALKALEAFLWSEKAASRVLPAPSAAPQASVKAHSEKTHSRGSRSTSDLHEITDPLVSLQLSLDLAGRNRKRATITTTKVFSETNSIVSSSSAALKPISPLSTNHNLSNLHHMPPEPSYAAKLALRLSVSISSPGGLPLGTPGPEGLLKRSHTLTQLDLDSVAQNPAPSVLTPVQVHVEGFQ